MNELVAKGDSGRERQRDGVGENTVLRGGMLYGYILCEDVLPLKEDWIADCNGSSGARHSYLIRCFGCGNLI